MYQLKQSQTARPLLFLMVDSADHTTPKTGLSPTVTISKNGAAFGSPAGAVTEVSAGWYKVAGNATDANTLGVLVLHAEAVGADPCDAVYEVVSYDPDATATQTGDAYARLGAPAGVSLAADIAVVDGVVDAIKPKTDNLPASPAAVGSAMTLQANQDVRNVTGNVTGSVGSVTDPVTAGTVSDKTGYSLTTTPPTAADIATAVWQAGTRTLSSFGTLVADVWAYATRKLTGTKQDFDALNDVSSADAQTAVTTALNAYDPPTRTEATADKDEVLAAVELVQDVTDQFVFTTPGVVDGSATITEANIEAISAGIVEALGGSADVPIFVETAAGAQLTNTLTGLAGMLRTRLNDLDGGNYTSEEIYYALNLAYRETVATARCHKAKTTLQLVAGTHTYDCGTVFEPISVSVGTDILNKTSVKQMGLKSENWDALSESTLARGVPTEWMPYTGGSIRLYPTPDGVTTTATVYGYAYPAALVNSTDVPVSLPAAYAVSAILDRAEAEARKMRATTSANAALYESLMGAWRNWCAKVATSVRGED